MRTQHHVVSNALRRSTKYRTRLIVPLRATTRGFPSHRRRTSRSTWSSPSSTSTTPTRPGRGAASNACRRAGGPFTPSPASSPTWRPSSTPPSGGRGRSGPAKSSKCAYSACSKRSVRERVCLPALYGSRGDMAWFWQRISLTRAKVRPVLCCFRNRMSRGCLQRKLRARQRTQRAASAAFALLGARAL